MPLKPIRRIARTAALTALFGSLVLLPALAGAGGQEPAALPGPTPAAEPVAPPPPPSQVSLVISGETGRRIPIAVPLVVAPIDPKVQSTLVDPFHEALTADLSSSLAFVLADPALPPKGARPPATREQADAWIAAGAQFLVDCALQLEPSDQVAVTVTLHDLRALKPILSRRYGGGARSVRRIAHFVANDLLKQFTGQPGPFLAKIAFVSDRDGRGSKEVYVMDWDGENQRPLTATRSLSLFPEFSPDGTRVVYQSFLRSRPDLFWVSSAGGQQTRVPVTTDLNTSPSFSPDGKTVVYNGSLRGNPEIFVVGLDGSGFRRLTDSASVDASPTFAPNGREIAFTSNRQGSPQIYLMDIEGTNVRRLTFAGNWSDEAAFSPKGDRMAYACRNEGDFQICVLDLASGRTFQITSGPGANEAPSWSPDGGKIAWQLRRGGSTQIVVANPDGTGLKTLTATGNNTSPSWSRVLE
ncbi:hypothetical protein FBQ97_10215 [Acidobacteria bacterium ACD]|nr:hypothetical protein [Acidobacteria bacterium ACD]